MDYISKTTHDGRNVRVKDYKKRVRRNRRRRKFLFFSFLLLCLTLILRHAPLFNIKEIRCVGNNAVSSDEIISASTISYNYNLFRTSTKKAAKNIESIPYIKSVKISRKLIGTIEIKTTECAVAGYVPLGEGYIYIDENCKMLEFNSVPPKVSAPIIQGTGVQSFESGKKLLTDDEGKNDLIIKAISAIKSNELTDKISIIDVPSTDKLTLYYNNRLEVFIGDIKDIDYKISLVVRTISELGENSKGYLNASNPGDVIYREKK